MMLGNLFKRYKADSSGNIGLLYIASFTAIVSLIGAAFDLAILGKNKERAQNIADAAALAALQFDGTLAQKEAVFSAHLQTLSDISRGGETPVAENVSITESNTVQTLSANVYIPHELVLLDLAGFDKINIQTEVQLGIENVEVALVLDISSSMNGARIAEARESTRFFVEELLENENLEERVTMSLVPFGGTVRVPVEMATLLETPLAELEDFSDDWIDGEWNQCFEFDAEDTKNGIPPNGTYRPTPDYFSFRARNPWCPRSGSELVPLTDDEELLKARIDTLTLSDGTGSDHGMAWGLETLNNEWENHFPGALEGTPAKNDDGTRKVMVFMSDGGITAQHFVRDVNKTGTPPYDSRKRVRVPFSDSLDAFYGACNRARQDGIEVYTIGYLLNRTAHKNYLINCATTPDHYIDAGSGELERIFADIAASISPLRVSN